MSISFRSNRGVDWLRYTVRAPRLMPLRLAPLSRRRRFMPAIYRMPSRTALGAADDNSPYRIRTFYCVPVPQGRIRHSMRYARAILFVIAFACNSKSEVDIEIYWCTVRHSHMSSNLETQFKLMV